MLSKFNTLCAELTENLEKFELGVAVQKLYDFIWDIFCDWYIELSKVRLQQGGAAKESAQAVLTFVLRGILKLLHPFMPFITEQIYQSLPHESESLMIAQWPEFDPALDFSAEEREFERIMGAIRAIRVRRAEMNVPPSRKTRVLIDTAYEETFRTGAVFFERLAFAFGVELSPPENPAACVGLITDGAKIYIPLDELVDKDAERARLGKELKAAQELLASIESKLSNASFVERAPAAVVEKQRESKARTEEKLRLIGESLASL